MRLVTMSILCAAIWPSGAALAQQDLPADDVYAYEEVSLPPAASETALEHALREGWGGEADNDDLPLYVRAAARLETREGPGFGIAFCGPGAPPCR